MKVSVNVLFGTSGVKNNSSHTHKIGSWYLVGVLFKISHEHDVLLHGRPQTVKSIYLFVLSRNES